MQVQRGKMHSEAMGRSSQRKGYGHYRQRQARRWCALGFVAIPLVLALLWVQFAAARESGELLYADRYCGCRELVSSWVRDYVWTQMIWLPCNTLFVLVWVALAVKLWSGKGRACRG